MISMDKSHAATGDSADKGQPAIGQMHTHQCIWNVTGGFLISGVVVHEGTNDPLGLVGWTTIVTFTQTSVADGTIDKSVLEHSWARVRSRCAAISSSGGTPSVRSIVSSR